VDVVERRDPHAPTIAAGLGFTPPHNGFRLSEDAVRAGARLVGSVHDLTEGTEFAAGAEVACPNLSQPNFVFRRLRPVGIIDWDRTQPGTRLDNVADFLWPLVHPGVCGDGKPAARMLHAAADARGWSGDALVDAMLAVVRRFQAIVVGDAGAEAWATGELEWHEQRPRRTRSTLSPSPGGGRSSTPSPAASGR
jgi:hypothetical protein